MFLILYSNFVRMRILTLLGFLFFASWVLVCICTPPPTNSAEQPSKVSVNLTISDEDVNCNNDLKGIYIVHILCFY